MLNCDVLAFISKSYSRSDKQSVKAMISMYECLLCRERENKGETEDAKKKKKKECIRTEGFNANVVAIKINSLLHTCIRYV